MRSHLTFQHHPADARGKRTVIALCIHLEDLARLPLHQGMHICDMARSVETAPDIEAAALNLSDLILALHTAGRMQSQGESANPGCTLEVCDDHASFGDIWGPLTEGTKKRMKEHIGGLGSVADAYNAGRRMTEPPASTPMSRTERIQWEILADEWDFRRSRGDRG